MIAHGQAVGGSGLSTRDLRAWVGWGRLVFKCDCCCEVWSGRADGV